MSNPTDDPTSLGHVLIEMGFMTQEDLTRALQERNSLEVLIGQLLVAKGIITERQLEKALEVQEGLRNKDKFKRAMAASAIAEETYSNVVELAATLGTKMAAVRAHCAKKRSNGSHR